MFTSSNTSIGRKRERISNTLTQLILQDINSESFMKTSIPNNENHLSHALSSVPITLNNSIIIRLFSLIKELNVSKHIVIQQCYFLVFTNLKLIKNMSLDLFYIL